MDRAQRTGVLLIAVAVLEMLLFLYGAMRRSYLALALPVAGAMAALTAITIWVGYTMLMLEEAPDEEMVEAQPTRSPAE